jgi:hypothetical protein
LLSVLFLIFCHLFLNFLLRLFYCISLFCFMFNCLKKVSNCYSVFLFLFFF